MIILLALLANLEVKSSRRAAVMSSGQAARPPRSRGSDPPPVPLPSPPRRFPALNLNPQAPPFVPQNAPQPQLVPPGVPVIPPEPARRRIAANPPPAPNVQQPRLNPARRRVRIIRDQPAPSAPIVLDQAGEQLLRQIADEQHARSLRFSHTFLYPQKNEGPQNPIDQYEHTLAALRHKEELKILDEAFRSHTEARSLWPMSRRTKLLVNLKLWLERFQYEKVHLACLRDKIEKRRVQLETDKHLLSSMSSMLQMTSASTFTSTTPKSEWL